jgi:ribonuclease E
VPTEQNNGLSKTEVETTSSSQLVGEQISRADQSVSHADGAEQHEASPKRRRTGRRVVRVAGAAGADVPVKIENSQTPETNHDSHAEHIAHARQSNQEIVDAASQQSENVSSAPSRHNNRREHSATGTNSRQRAAKSSAITAPVVNDTVEFEEPKVKSRKTTTRTLSTAGEDDQRRASVKQERSERAAKAVDSIRFLQVDTTHAAPATTQQPLHNKPMTSLLFQEPVLPVTSKPSNTSHDEESGDEDNSRRSTTKRGKNQRRQETVIELIEHGNQRNHDSNDSRDADSTRSSDDDHAGRSRRSRRMNALERRAAAEVGQIEDDLEFDEIPYDPIDDDVQSMKSSRRSRSRISDSEESTNRRERVEDSEPEEEHAEGRRHRSIIRENDDDDNDSTVTRRRRRRRGGAKASEEEVSEQSSSKRSRKQQYIDEITNIEGSTRLEAKRQRRRDNRRDRSRQTQLIEQDFLARRENVNRIMVVREKEQHTQISVVEDDILVEHYVSDIQEVATVGNIYLGRVQNVLPSMEAAFVDIGQARNGVLYAGEVNWDSARLDGQPRRIELAFKSGDPVLVQVTKDPIGHKGARLTSQVTLAGRFLVLVPSGGMTGVSRKLSEHERSRLKGIVTKIAPKDMGVIIRTAADHASEEAITKDLENLVRQWENVEKKRDSAKHHKKPKLLKGEPDVAIRVVRDIFNDDFNELIVEGEQVYERISEYLDSMAPDLRQKLNKWDPADHEGSDVFDRWQIDGQLRKGMERQVYLPSGGSLVIDRTEAMTTIDVNTGRFIGKGKSLEETVTRCNLEASEEIARQLRLRDIGGMVMIDYVDMVMQANRDLVLRRLVECLARDRTKHQVAEVTSLGLVQMTRKRVGQGLVEAFSEECPTCKGRGFILHDEPTISASYDDPYAVKGGDPFVKSVPKHHAQPKESAAPKGSSPDVKAKLAKIAAAAGAATVQSASEDTD